MPDSTPQLRTALLIEDDQEVARTMRGLLGDPGQGQVTMKHATSVADAGAQLSSPGVDVVLLDCSLPDISGLDAIAQVRVVAPRMAIVLLSDPEGEDAAIEAMQAGAQDYLIKGQIESRELLRSLRNAFERKLLQEALFAEKERAQETLDCMGDGVICSDDWGAVTYLNKVAESLTGWNLQEAVGQPMSSVFRIVDAASREIIANPMDRAIRDNRTGHLQINAILIRRDGAEAYIEDSAAPIHDRSGATTGSVIVFRDSSTAQALTDRLIHASQHDHLTGLPNRLLLVDRIDQAIALADRHKNQVAVLFLDLDGFKQINDSLGHLTGDKMLQSIGHRLRFSVRHPDTVCRQGGDEFIVLLQDVNGPKDVTMAAKRVLTAVNGIYQIDSHALRVSASMGISVYPANGEDAEALINNADFAMYHAKRQRNQGFIFFKPGMNLAAIERRRIEEETRQASEAEGHHTAHPAQVQFQEEQTHVSGGDQGQMKFVEAQARLF